MYSYVSFILTSPRYYDIKQADVGAVTGQIGTYAELVLIVSELFVGILVDTIGRKAIIIVCMITTAVSLACVPLFSSIYPSFLILRTLVGCGSVTIGNIPLVPDYIQR